MRKLLFTLLLFTGLLVGCSSTSLNPAEETDEMKTVAQQQGDTKLNDKNSLESLDTVYRSAHEEGVSFRFSQAVREFGFPIYNIPDYSIIYPDGNYTSPVRVEKNKQYHEIMQVITSVGKEHSTQITMKISNYIKSG